ncbi:MAG: Gfo/Idh/MocA family oxidoreductase [bacterium]|jgi:predicted dehydrogenase|nr:Gfo/Idh/MocA family oxidoreductase [bacterium]
MFFCSKPDHLPNAVVIGVGSLGQHHARIYAKHNKVNLLAVVDTAAEARESIARTYGCQAFADVTEIQDRIDLVSLVVPTTDHYRLAAQLIEKGIPVLVEKPITLTVAEGETLVALAREKRVILQVGHIERFNPAVIELCHRIENPLFIECHRLGPPAPRVKDMGVVLDLMIHDLDLILSVVRCDIAHIEAVGVPILSPQEDIANARLRFESGCIANVTCSRVTPEKQRKIRFFQNDAYFSLDYLKPDLQIYRKITQADGSIQITHDHPKLGKEEPLYAEIDSFIECVLQGKTPVVTGEDGIRALRLASRITNQVEQLTETLFHYQKNGNNSA